MSEEDEDFVEDYFKLLQICLLNSKIQLISIQIQTMLGLTFPLTELNISKDHEFILAIFQTNEDFRTLLKDTYSLRKVCKDRVEFFKSIINK